MNIQLPVQMDQEAFLAWVQGREERYELDRGRVILTTGGSRGHWQITANLLKALVPPRRRRRREKAAEYLRLPSLLAYLVVAQDEMKAWVWIRGAKDFPPSAEVFEGRDAVVRIEPLKIDLPFAAIYDRVGLQ